MKTACSWVALTSLNILVETLLAQTTTMRQLSNDLWDLATEVKTTNCRQQASQRCMSLCNANAGPSAVRRATTTELAPSSGDRVQHG